MKHQFTVLYEMRHYLLLWLTQMISGLGSAMTAYALVIWSYTQEGSALRTALLMVCSYAPYVVMSLFAGAVSDRWDKKRTMLVCDALAAASTLCVLLLLKTDTLKIRHLYAVNAVTGLMNTVQQPASEVMTTLLLPKKYYQKVGGLRYFSSSLSSVLTPVLATALLAFGGMDIVFAVDLGSFVLAFLVLLFAIPVPGQKLPAGDRESFFRTVSGGLRYLRQEKGILHLMLFLAAINLTASMYQAAFPAMLLSRPRGGTTALGIMNTVTGVTMLAGSILASLLKTPKSRVKAIWYCLMLSMSTENFLLAFGRTLPVWCAGAFLGWISIPLMNANLDAVYRSRIPRELQGRVFAARNSFQFFTIPLGYFLGGFAVDRLFEPLMALQSGDSFLNRCFGTGKGSGAAFFFAVIGVLGMLTCLFFRRDKHIHRLEA
ncbi:MAG: MFS transporter [Oscillospiraceae bacterium]|nr:MFS transporter [Oscillospiraceae bacterium]